jgi:chromosome segregation ATPase
VKKKRPLSELATAAGELEAEIDKIDALTRRLAKLELDSRKNILSAAELMKEAADGHGRFATQLGAVVDAVNALRARQNESAGALNEMAANLDSRRQTFEALEERFGALAQEARRVTELFQEKPADGESRDGLLAKMRSAGEALAPVIESARSLATDAGEAKLSDLQRDADGLRQQLQALANKLKQAAATN